MCVVSMIMDDWNKKYNDDWHKKYPGGWEQSPTYNFLAFATKQDIEELRKEIQELKKLIEAAHLYDVATGQPECQDEEKLAILQKLAEAIGLDISDLMEKLKK